MTPPATPTGHLDAQALAWPEPACGHEGHDTMMGHINNLVVKLVKDNLGEAGVAEMFKAAELEPRSFQPEMIYPEEDFQALFRGAQKVFDADADTAEVVFSKFFMEVSPRMFPAIFEHAKCARRLFEKIPLIHANFPAAASRSAYREKVFIAESTPERVVLEYDSPNRLCTTLRTVAGHVLDFYHEQGTITETSCQKKGAPRCRVVVEFHEPSPAT